MAEETIKTSSDDFGELIDKTLESQADKTFEKQVFRRFKARDVAAKDWISGLVKNGFRGALKNGNMHMSDEMPDVGVLSLAPALSALLTELSLLKQESYVLPNGEKSVSFADMLTVSKNETLYANKVMYAVIGAICKLLSECYPDGLDGNLDDVLLSSTPYYDDSALKDRAKWKNGGYLDSASWVFLAADNIETFLNRVKSEIPAALENVVWKISVSETIVKENGDEEKRVKDYLYAHKDGGTERILKAVRKIYVSCVKVACDSIVLRDKKPVGWSFRKMKNNGESADPSLYFSYVASTVYLGLYKRFNSSKDDADKNDIIDRLRGFEALLAADAETNSFEFYKDITRDDALADTVKQLNKFAKSRRNQGIADFAEFLGSLTAKEREELDFLYNVINGGEPLSYKIRPNSDRALFQRLKQALVEFSDMLWNDGFGNSPNRVGFKHNMAKGPCFEDGSVVDMDVLPRSSRDNSFFNNLFVIGILLNAAYDVEQLARDKANGTDEYEQMLKTFQLSVQNTQRCYDEMASKGLLYKIDSYILDFSERVDEYNAELTKQLRRVNMAVVPLLPLMLKSNNLINEYVVRFPQKQMTDSLKDIIRNRKTDADGMANWVWDKDGYNAITNYYYVDALIAFYRYYERFEAPYVNSEETLRKQERDLNAKSVADREKAVAESESKMQAIIDSLKAQVDDARSVRETIARFVVNGLIDLVHGQLTAEKLIGSLDKKELEDNDNTIAALKAINGETDEVKVSTLVDVLNKLQLLSLIMMSNKTDGTAKSLLVKADDDSTSNLGSLINKLFGKNGDVSGFLLSLLKCVMPLPAKPVGSDDNK